MIISKTGNIITKQRKIAQRGEECAAQYLEKNGYKILARNWRLGRFAEIDLIAQDKQGLIVFVEVKTRESDICPFGILTKGFESVNWQKRQKIVVAAKNYLSRLRQEREARFDVIVIVVEKHLPGCSLSDMQLIHVQEAFYP